jgi:hypothetical protein
MDDDIGMGRTFWATSTWLNQRRDVRPGDGLCPGRFRCRGGSAASASHACHGCALFAREDWAERPFRTVRRDDERGSWPISTASGRR